MLVGSLSQALGWHQGDEEKQVSSFVWNWAKTQQLACYVFAGGVGSLGVSLAARFIGKGNAKRDGGVALVAVVALTSSWGIAWLGSRIEDYDDPQALHKMQREALSMTYEQITAKHNIDKVIQYQIVPFDVFKGKCRYALKRTHLPEVIGTWDFNALYRYQLLSVSECHSLMSLINNYRVVDLDRKIQAIDRRYPNRLSYQLERCRVREQQVIRECDQQLTKRRMQNVDVERDRIHNQSVKDSSFQELCGNLAWQAALMQRDRQLQKMQNDEIFIRRSPKAKWEQECYQRECDQAQGACQEEMAAYQRRFIDLVASL
ncbi:MAG: hypothetical protein NTZ52_03565 [Chlamydiae bacterium]|nr:hypothetical protein [Chlamydiota bacterium]